MLEPSRKLAALIIVCAAICVSGRVLAQGASASLGGVVRTRDGATIAGAVVNARSEDTGAVRTATTGPDGRFWMDVLLPGRWTVVATSPDGAISRSESMSLALGEVREVLLVVGEGNVERVEVSAEAPLVDRLRTQGEFRVDRSETETLPLVTRDVTQLAMLNSAVRPMPEGNLYGERASAFVINGQTGRSNSFLVDGLDNNDQSSGTSMNSFFSRQVIREFVVLSHQFAPEYGRASGGVVNVVTEGGSNEFRTGAFLQGSGRGWNSESAFIPELPGSDKVDRTNRQLQAGFHMGGPFKKDKAFYFVAYEHGEFDDVIPYLGYPGGESPGGWTVSEVRDDNFFVRTDFNLGSSNLLKVRASGDRRATPNLGVGAQTAPDAGFLLEEQDLQFATTLTTVVSPAVINEMRLMAGRSEFHQFANSAVPGVGRPSSRFGGNDLNRQLRDEDRIQIVENVSWRISDHTLKFGLDATRSRTRYQVRFNPNGSFDYTSDLPFEPGDCGDLLFSDTIRLPTDPDERDAAIRAGIYGACDRTESQRGDDDDGDGIVDEKGYLNTYPLVYRFLEGEPDVTLDDTRISLFAQDTWQAGPKWRFNYGVRYDVSTYVPAPDAIVPSTLIPNGGSSRDEDNVAPRIGFTFSPWKNDRLVVRGGAGVYYDKLVLAFPAVAATLSGTQLKLVFPGPFTLEITEDLVEEIGVDVLQQGGVFLPELVMWFSTGTDLQTPYTTQYTLGVEGAAGSRGAWSVDAIQAFGYNLPLMRDLNPVVAINPPCPVEGDLGCIGIPVHRDPDFGSIAAVVTEGRSWYSGVDLGWTWRGQTTRYRVGYTWSKSEDLGPDPLKGGIYLPPNSDDLASERGPSDFDRRHRLVLSGETVLPWGGFRLSGVVRLASEAPFNVVTGLDENRDGINSDRPEGVSRNSGDSTPLEPINEIRVLEGLPEVTSLTAPSFAQVDVRIAWPFGVSDAGGEGEVFLQVFNLFDRFNGADVVGRVTSANFGQPGRLAGPPRTVELGLRFGF